MAASGYPFVKKTFQVPLTRIMHEGRLRVSPVVLRVWSGRRVQTAPFPPLGRVCCELPGFEAAITEGTCQSGGRAE